MARGRRGRNGWWSEPPWWAWVAIVAGAAFLAVGLPVALSNPRTSPPAEGRTFQEAYGTTSAPVADVRLAVVGDSVSEANSNDFPAGDLGDRSWVHYAVGDGLVFAGGYAKGGYTTAQLLPNVAPVDADVLVLIAGTNDSGQGVPFATSADNLRKIAATVGAPRVVVSSIPPRDDAPRVAVDYNQQLQALAAGEGWEFVDATAGIRDGDRYAQGMTDDGIHPTAQAAQVIGAAIRAQLLGAP